MTPINLLVPDLAVQGVPEKCSFSRRENLCQRSIFYGTPGTPNKGIHGKDDENEIDNAPHHDAVVNVSKKIKNK